MCQSPGTPSGSEYWHIGDTTMRLRSVSERCWKGWNNAMALASKTELQCNRMRLAAMLRQWIAACHWRNR
ncbi:MAG: hypothetical protein ABWZ08_13140 [Pseudoxanthomonas sp.]